MSYEVVKSEKVFQGKILNVESDIITLPNGETTVREIVKHNGAAAMLPIDDKGKIWLVKQYRHSARKMTLEIPAGTIEEGESPYDCAIREIEEEIGYKCYNMKPLITMYSAIGFCDEQIHIYICRDLTKSQAQPDDDEFITIERHSLRDCMRMIKNGEICDSKTITALLAYKVLMNEEY